MKLTDRSSFIPDQAIWPNVVDTHNFEIYTQTKTWNPHFKKNNNETCFHTKLLSARFIGLWWFYHIRWLKKRSTLLQWSDMGSDRNILYPDVMCLLCTFRKSFFITFEQLARITTLKYVPRFCDIRICTNVIFSIPFGCKWVREFWLSAGNFQRLFVK